MPDAIDDQDNPEWTEADFARARPAKDILPEKLFNALTRGPGRPKKDDAKVSVTLRLDPDIVSRFKAGGPGWQTRMNDALRAAAPLSKKRRSR